MFGGIDFFYILLFNRHICPECVIDNALFAVMKSDICCIITQKQTIICRNRAVSSIRGSSGKFHRSGPECSLHLCLFYGVC